MDSHSQVDGQPQHTRDLSGSNEGHSHRQDEHDDHGDHAHDADAHSHGEAHTHDDDHDHDHGGEHLHGEPDHKHATGLKGLLENIPFFHSHSHGDARFDSALESSERGIWALKVSLLGLGITAAFQLIIVLISGSVALLADTIHNFSDALTALPLWLAFALSRRPASRRYTYGYGRAEDVAGVVIVGMILLSAGVALYESYQKLIDPQPIANIFWVMAASIVGFIGNEAVAALRMRVGKEIGSAALVADGQHARVDGLTSLAVLVGAIGVLLGFPLADPLVGLLITVAILVIVKDAAVTMWRRLMDAIEPDTLDQIERTVRATPGVEGMHGLRVRWLGHKLQAEMHILVDGRLSTLDSHNLAEAARHALFHALPQLTSIMIHVDPADESAHELTRHHTAASETAQSASMH